MLRDRLKLWNAGSKYNRRHLPQHSDQKRATKSSCVDHDCVPHGPTNVRAQWCTSPALDPNEAIQKSTALASTCATWTAQDDQSHADRVVQPVFGSTLLTVGSSYACLKPSRIPGTPEEDRHLRMTLTQVSGYLERFVGQESWRHPYEEPAFELQKLAADANMAITSQKYDSHHIWRDLVALFEPVCNLMPKFNQSNLLVLHPRTLIVLLRLLVSPQSFSETESATLDAVKKMFHAAATSALVDQHPIRLLCGMPAGQTVLLLHHLLKLMDEQLYSRIDESGPEGRVFVARERTYTARVLASLGNTSWASRELGSIIDSFGDDIDLLTRADAYRTYGYAMTLSDHAGTPGSIEKKMQEADNVLSYALDLFTQASRSHEVMYTRMALAQVARQSVKLEAAEMHLRAAIDTWEQAKTHQSQGGSKMVLDLHHVLLEQNKIDEALDLKHRYPPYFEKSKG